MTKRIFMLLAVLLLVAMQMPVSAQSISSASLTYTFNGQQSVLPADVDKRLLNDKRRGETACKRNVERIAYTPAARRVALQRTADGAAQIAVGKFQRAEPVAVGGEPEGGIVAIRQRRLHAYSIVQTISETANCLRIQLNRT